MKVKVKKFKAKKPRIKNNKFKTAWNRARNLICYRKYEAAQSSFETLLEWPNVGSEDQTKIAASIMYCRKATLGLLDLRQWGCGIWFGSEEISESEMTYILRHGKRRSGEGAKGVRKGRVSIGSAIHNLFEEKGIDDVTLKMAKKMAREINPKSKFNEHHFSYYKSMYRKTLKSLKIDDSGTKSGRVSGKRKPKIRRKRTQ